MKWNECNCKFQNKKIDCSSTSAINTVVQKLVDKEKIIVYKDWIESKTFPHFSWAGSANEVIYYFAESDMKLSNISYDKIRKLSLFNVDVLNVDKSGFIMLLSITGISSLNNICFL